MTTIRQPEVTVNITPAIQAVSNAPQRVLIVGQKNGGTAVAGALVQNILNDNSQNGLFGIDSMIAGMVRNFKKINQVTQLDAISLDDAGGAAAASGNVTFTVGPATEAGTIIVTIGSAEDHVYEIPVADTDNVTTIGDALEALVTADTGAPFTATNTAGDVSIDAVNGGEEGNSIGISLSGVVAGVTTAITAMSGGATNPTLTTVFDVIDERRYQTIVWPSTYDIDTVKDFLDARFNVDNILLDGIAIVSQTDTLANHIVALNLQNSQSLVIHANESVSESLYEGSALFELDNNISAQFAAIRSLRLTDGANISRYIVSRTGALDNTGGPAIASLPYFNTPMPYLPLLEIGYGFTSNEIKQLEAAGGFVIGNNIGGNGVLLGEVVTTYKTDAASNPDVTYHFLNLVDTASNAREYFFNNLKSTYVQSRLTEGSIEPGRVMANETSIRASLTGFYSDLSKPGYVLTESGEPALKFFKDNLDVTIDKQAGLVQFSSRVPYVTQLRQIIGNMQVVFSINE